MKYILITLMFIAIIAFFLSCSMPKYSTHLTVDKVIKNMPTGQVVTFKERSHQWFLPVDTLHENSIITMATIYKQ